MSIGSNINPSIWGNAGWIFLKNIAKGYPDKPNVEDKERYKKYYELIGFVLPCSKCRMNYQQHWREVPIDGYLHNKNTLYRWVNIIKSKTNPMQQQFKNRMINERIKRIKDSRKDRLSSRSNCRGCGR